jgi:hypothetical protein
VEGNHELDLYARLPDRGYQGEGQKPAGLSLEGLGLDVRLGFIGSMGIREAGKNRSRESRRLQKISGQGRPHFSHTTSFRTQVLFI